MLVPALLLVISCKEFLDVKPKGVIIAQSLSDYEGLLNGTKMVNPFGINTLIHFPTDDIIDLNFSPQSLSSPKGNTYFWVDYINNTRINPDLWADLYKQIANLNLIKEGVLTATDGTKQQKKQYYAEALVGNSYYYHHLLSFFSVAYNKNTAAQEYGLPYVTSTDVSKPIPSRPSLQAMYEQLILDIVSAIPDLPETNINNMRVSKLAAYGMLSRIYMSMGDFPNALKYADLVLATGQAKILNYADYTSSQVPSTNINPEELWVRYTNNTGFTCSPDLLANFNLTTDLRIQKLFQKKTDGTYTYGGITAYNPNRGITYAEIYLNKAECLARSGDSKGALEIINTVIRKNRFKATDYLALSASTAEEALQQVLKERRRELAFKGIRWIDMKRLDQEKRIPEVKRIAKDGVTVLAKLMPGSTAYTYQIPLMVQSFNADMPLNKR